MTTDAPNPPATPTTTAPAAHHLCDNLGGAEPVLDREHDGLGAEQGPRAPRRGADGIAFVAITTRSIAPTSAGSQVAATRTTPSPLDP